MKQTVKIKGMSCNHCKMAVEKAIKKINGVNNVNVSLFLKEAEIDTNNVIDASVIKQAIKDAGYEVGE